MVLHGGEGGACAGYDATCSWRSKACGPSSTLRAERGEPNKRLLSGAQYDRPNG